MSRRVLVALTTLALAGAAAGCGQQKNDVKQPDAEITALPEQYRAGAKLFVERCSGCHTLDIVGAEGGAAKVGSNERTDGPNFNVRKENKEDVLYALRNGGFSGAIMPPNIVVGEEAEQVAEFLAAYAGKKN
jgi:mono/diheme cytochrome c family protein